MCQRPKRKMQNFHTKLHEIILSFINLNYLEVQSHRYHFFLSNICLFKFQNFQALDKCQLGNLVQDKEVKLDSTGQVHQLVVLT